MRPVSVLLCVGFAVLSTMGYVCIDRRVADITLREKTQRYYIKLNIINRGARGATRPAQAVY